MRSLLFLVLILFSFSLGADNHDPHSAKLSRVATQKSWLNLLHYKSTGFLRSLESTVDDDRFFLSTNGAQDSLSELNATIAAFKQDTLRDKQHPQCNFPARFHFVKKQFPEIYFSEKVCTEFNEWKSDIDAESLTLIYPIAYLNSPSSMFGHTLFRFNRKSGSSPLLDFSLSYAASVDTEDNELTFSIKGLTGGYPGVFSIQPYYQKIKEYTYLESRDIWEFDLNLTEEELAQMIRHIWEIKDVSIDYYFFDENCAYQLLSLLDVANENFNLAEQFQLSVIPADTVKQIIEVKLTSKTNYRPSSKTRLDNLLKASTIDIQSIAKNLINSEVNIDVLLDGLSLDKKILALELAYQYSRFLATRNKIPNLKQQSLKLLSYRSQLPEASTLTHLTYKDYEPNSHLSKRVSLGFGTKDDIDYSELSIRMAYHDFLDPIDGFLPGTQLELFHLRLKKFEQADVQLSELTFINIRSLNPSDDFIDSMSWSIATGLRRDNKHGLPLSFYIDGGLGETIQLSSQLYYLLASTRFDIGDDHSNKHEIKIGPTIGWLYQSGHWNAHIESSSYINLTNFRFATNIARLSLSHKLSSQLQLRHEVSYVHSKVDKNFDNKINLMWYF